MTIDDILAQLDALANAADAVEMAKYHKTTRRVLGIKVPVLTELSKDIREAVTLDERLALCADLWAADIHETRILAAKLLEQARIRPDDTEAWDLIASWVPDFDGWAIADHVCKSGEKRLIADPSRIDQVENWTVSPHMWTRRAALVITLPWTKMTFPKEADLAIRERVLDWAGGYVRDHDWFIQKAIGWWLRDLSKRDPERVRSFIDAHGAAMKPFARKEALRLIKD
jgi:3-methyladenine DNA glycosylase AlkD